MPPARSAAKGKGLAWALAALALGAAAAFGLPYLARQVPWPLEERLARWQEEVPPLERCAPRSRRGAALFEQAVRRVYPIYPSDRELPVTVTLIRGESVNAFATLGGRIYVYEGLVRQTASAEELAGVVAHEIEHVKRRHVIQGALVRVVTSQLLHQVFPGAAGPEVGSIFLKMRFSRDQEEEADQGGLQRLHDARVDVAGVQHFFERARSQALVPAILSDHPDDRSRARLAARFRTASTVPIMSQQEWDVVKRACR